jgi:hypothetical protein
MDRDAYVMARRAYRMAFATMLVAIAALLVAGAAHLHSEWGGALLSRIAGDAPPNRVAVWSAGGGAPRYAKGL